MNSNAARQTSFEIARAEEPLHPLFRSRPKISLRNRSRVWLVNAAPGGRRVTSTSTLFGRSQLGLLHFGQTRGFSSARGSHSCPHRQRQPVRVTTPIDCVPSFMTFLQEQTYQRSMHPSSARQGQIVYTNSIYNLYKLSSPATAVKAKSSGRTRIGRRLGCQEIRSRTIGAESEIVETLDRNCQAPVRRPCTLSEALVRSRRRVLGHVELLEGNGDDRDHA
jgi:hypothetical protein